MLKPAELTDEWKKDCRIDETQLKREILNIPNLHAKYLRLLQEYRFALHKVTFDYNKMENLRYHYYLGTLDEETLTEYGWEQFELHITKTGVERFLRSDEILNTLEQKKIIYQQLISTCESIMSELKSRTYQIRGAIDMVKFEMGS